VKGVAADAQDLTGMEKGEDVQTVLQNEDQNGHARTSFKLPSLSWGPWWEEIGSKDTEKESSTPGASGLLLFLLLGLSSFGDPHT
jgi:hypothetical protein